MLQYTPTQAKEPSNILLLAQSSSLWPDHSTPPIEEFQIKYRRCCEAHAW